jgi:hypothetical protein
MFEVHVSSPNRRIFVADFGTPEIPSWEIRRAGREWEGIYNSRDGALAVIEEEIAALK